MSRYAWLCWVAALACGALEPELGPLAVGRCVNEDSDPNQRVSYRVDIQPIFRGTNGSVGCSCHLPTSIDPIGIELGGLDLSEYARLREGGNLSGTDIVVEGRPCDSDLVKKLGPTPPFGSRMPFDGPPMLDDLRRQLIADWIAEGAQNDE